jgi:hypothetical protein
MESEMTNSFPTYSQCPGEVYNEFWEVENQPTIDIEELLKGKRFDKNLMEWVEDTTQHRIDYYKEGDLSLRWKYCKTMHAAIAKAYKMIQTGEYTIIRIETEHPSIGQD